MFTPRRAAIYFFIGKNSTCCGGKKSTKGRAVNTISFRTFLYAFILTATPAFHPFFLFINALFIRIACLQKFLGPMVLGHTEDRDGPSERLCAFSFYSSALKPQHIHTGYLFLSGLFLFSRDFSIFVYILFSFFLLYNLVYKIS